MNEIFAGRINRISEHTHHHRWAYLMTLASLVILTGIGYAYYRYPPFVEFKHGTWGTTLEFGAKPGTSYAVHSNGSIIVNWYGECEYNPDGSRTGYARRTFSKPLWSQNQYNFSSTGLEVCE